MKEYHEHNNHPDFKMVVQAYRVFPYYQPDYPFGVDSYSTFESHAVIYVDGSIILTMFECTYASWSASTGFLMSGSLYDRNAYRLTPDSLNELAPLIEHERLRRDWSEGYNDGDGI